jgi:hypothetical protein
MVAQGHAIDQLCDNEYRPSTVIARGDAEVVVRLRASH